MAAVAAQRFDGGDEAPLDIGQANLARTDRLAVDHHGARAAIARAAAIFGPRKVRRIAQRPEQRRRRIHAVIDRTIVDG